MRTEMCETKTREEAEAKMPWAVAIVRVHGGYLGFESHDDYVTWMNQI